MTKEELEKEAEDKGIKYADSLEYTISKFSDEEGYCWSQVEQAYEKGALDFAEPREKRIEELEAEVKEWKDKADLWCKTANLKDHNIMINKELEKENAELEAQIEKLIDFVLSKTECCDVCPITDTCINSEGTCPYAGILAKGEEEVTREWLMQKIAKEIKEK